VKSLAGSYIEKVLKISSIFETSVSLDTLEKHALEVACDVLECHEAIFIPKLNVTKKNSQDHHKKDKISAWVRAGSEKLGVLELSQKNIGTFTKEDQKLCTLLSIMMGQAMKMVSQVELIKDMNDEVFDLVTTMIDAKDEYTAGHSKRVGFYSAKIGEALGLSEDKISKLRLGGVLHDIGKIGIHDAILKKPAKLTPEEYTEIMRHPEISAEMLKKYKYFKDVLHIAQDHHLRPDGKGYPKAKSGSDRQYKAWEDVDELTRIVTVADAFDAMWGGRSYQARMSLPKTVQEFQNLCNLQFDSESVRGLVLYLEQRYGSDALIEKSVKKKAA
jgi:putative nucleotidyltransferase with HDIG domain